MNEDSKLKTELEAFLETEKVASDSKQEKVVLKSTGLVEKIDRTLVTEDGRQLLLESK